MIILGAIIGYFMNGGWGAFLGAGVGLGIEVANVIEALIVVGIKTAWGDWQAWRKSIHATTSVKPREDDAWVETD